MDLQGPLAEAEVTRYQHKKALLQEEIENLDRQIDDLKQQRKSTPHHIPVKDLPGSDRFSRLLAERKHFIDTIKLIAYRAETNMAAVLRDKLSRPDDAALYYGKSTTPKSTSSPTWKPGPSPYACII